MQNSLKALLFSTSEPLTIKVLRDVLRRYRVALEADLAKAAQEDKGTIESLLGEYPEVIKTSEVEEALKILAKQLEEKEDIYRLLEGPDGYSLALAPQYAPWIRLLRNEDKPMKLSPAAMETLALIAYRQPITRAEMELIRGVSVDSAVQKLTEHGLIYVQGQANLPGRPRLYATTDEFLKFCGITTLEELPASDVLPKQQVDEWVQDEGKREVYSEQDMGLAEAETELV